jgi:nitrogen regulatory protein PII
VKKVEAIIKPSKTEPVKEALMAVGRGNENWSGISKLSRVKSSN